MDRPVEKLSVLDVVASPFSARALKTLIHSVKGGWKLLKKSVGFQNL